MKNQKVDMINNFYSVLLLGLTSCYPLDKVNDKPELKDETRYPNGTVVGTYTYSDNEGNPIHVKYYADDASYGVELKSVKVVDTSTEDSAWQSSNFDTLKPIETPLGTGSDFFTLNNYEVNKQKKIDLDNEKNYAKKMNSYRIAPGYDKLYQNEIKAPRHCEKDKVRVYLDKEKKIIKRALNNYRTAMDCDRF